MKRVRLIYGILLLLGVLFATTAFARPVYLKDGTVIQAQQVWQEDDRVYVLVNRDSLIFFYPEEVSLKKTFAKRPGAAPSVKKKTAVTGGQVAPASQAAPTQTQPKAAAVVQAAAPPTAVKQPQPAPAAGVTTPPSTPATAQPQATKPAPAPAPPQSKPATPAPPQATAPPAKTAPVATAPAPPPTKPRPPATTTSTKPRPPKAQPPASQLQGGGGIVGLAILGGIGAVCLLLVASLWKIFTKAGEAGWKSLVPIYNFLVLLRIAGCPTRWFFMMFIPIANLWYGVLMYLRLAEKFGKSHLFGFGLCFLSFIFFPLLAFGSASYEQPQSDAFTFDEDWGEEPNKS